MPARKGHRRDRAEAEAAIAAQQAGKKRRRAPVEFEATPLGTLAWTSVDASVLKAKDISDQGFLSLQEIDGDAFDMKVLQADAAEEKAGQASEGGDEDAAAAAPPADAAAGDGTKPSKSGKAARKRKRKRRKKGGQSKGAAEPTKSKGQAIPLLPADQVEDVDMSEWHQFELHYQLVRNLQRQRFERPTAIQAAVMVPAVKHFKDVVAAAETGSGKTLAFGLPILHRLIDRRMRLGMGVDREDGEQVKSWSRLPALVLCPTRELAMQTMRHMEAAATGTTVRVGSIVGGMAMPKQKRVLDSRPDVIVATPGRFWAQVETGHPYLSDLRLLQFLVLDEADRMLERGHFDDLKQILGRAHPPGRPTPAQAIADLMASLRPQRPNGRKPSAKGDNDDEAGKVGPSVPAEDVALPGATAVEPADDLGDEEAPNGSLLVHPRKHYKRQTFLFSATLGFATVAAARGAQLSLLDDAAGQAHTKNQRRRVKKALESVSPLEAVMIQVGMQPRPMIVRILRLRPGEEVPADAEQKADGTCLLFGQQAIDHVGGDGEAAVVGGSKAARDTRDPLALPAGLRLLKASCVGGGRNENLYHFLLTHAGRTIVFVNKISQLKQLHQLLLALRLPVVSLHASMQQRQRLKALDRFRSNPGAILVATDVAARGLDIKGVEFVVHYGMPMSIESFVHRSGRTARAGKAGVALALVEPGDERTYQRTCAALNRPEGFMELVVPPGYRRALVARVSLASKIAKAESQLTRESSARGWLRHTAAEMGVQLDDTTRREAALGPEEGEEDEEEAEQGRWAAERAAVKLQEQRDELSSLLAEAVLPARVSRQFVDAGTAGQAIGKTLSQAVAGARLGGKAGGKKKSGGVVSKPRSGGIVAPSLGGAAGGLAPVGIAALGRRRG